MLTKQDLAVLKRACQSKVRGSLAEDAAQEAAILLHRDGRDLPAYEPDRGRILRWWARCGSAHVLAREGRRRLAEARILPEARSFDPREPITDRAALLADAFDRLPRLYRRTLQTWAEHETIPAAALHLGVNGHTFVTRRRTGIALLRAAVHRDELRLARVGW